MSAREIHSEVLIAEHPVLRMRVALVVPVVPDGAPYAVAEGIVRRRLAATTGRCPCGAVADYGDPQAGQVGVGEVAHAGSCPASTTKLVKACRRWLQ